MKSCVSLCLNFKKKKTVRLSDIFPKKERFFARHETFILELTILFSQCLSSWSQSPAPPGQQVWSCVVISWWGCWTSSVVSTWTWPGSTPPPGMTTSPPCSWGAREACSWMMPAMIWRGLNEIILIGLNEIILIGLKNIFVGFIWTREEVSPLHVAPDNAHSMNSEDSAKIFDSIQCW